MKESLSVLVVEDGKSDFLFLKKHLENLDSWDVSVERAVTFEEAQSTLGRIEIDICFIDYHLNNEVAEDFLVKIQVLRDYVPMILISGLPSEKLRNLAIENEVDDFISKEDVSYTLLTRIIRYCVANNRAKLKAKVQEQKYLNLFNNSLEAIFTADDDFQIIRANQAFKELFKVDGSTEIDFRDFFQGKDLRQFFSTLSIGENRNSNRTKLYNLQGEELEVYVTITRIHNESEKAAYQVVIHDITEFEKIQQKLHEVDKSNLIRRMARIIGHEVRNPLTNILLATEEMKDDYSDNEDALLMLGMIERNSKRISSLIDSFLKNSINSELDKKDCVLEDVLQDSFANCLDRIKLQQVDYTLDGFDSRTEMSLDVEKIKIVFTNIIINATEALSAQANPKLTISLLKENDKRIVEISDNGCGMTEEVKANLFSPFYSSKQGGLGLGMSNSKKILDDHGASVKVESSENQGTTFRITF